MVPDYQAWDQLLLIGTLSGLFCYYRRDDPRFPEEVGYQDPDQKKSAGYPDERNKEIARLFWPWLVKGPDRKDIDKEAEAQSEKEADGFDHEPDIT
jgi:hypothetical protein